MLSNDEKMVRKKGSYDFYLILATVAVLFIISAICVYGMFYFKWAQIQQLAPNVKMNYMNSMNTVIAPFIIALIVLLGICVPKRLMPVNWLNRFGFFLLLATPAVAFWQGLKIALLGVLGAALILQIVVLGLAIGGSKWLTFEKSGYWVRVGSSLIHLGIILFVFDLFFYKQQTLHLVLFWVTTGATVVGMLFCFYSETVVAAIKRLVPGK